MLLIARYLKCIQIRISTVVLDVGSVQAVAEEFVQPIIVLNSVSTDDCRFRDLSVLLAVLLATFQLLRGNGVGTRKDHVVSMTSAAVGRMVQGARPYRRGIAY